MNYKGGERITMLAGFRALRDYSIKDENTKTVSALLCVKEYETAEAVSHLKEEMASLKGKNASLQQKLLGYRAAEIPLGEGVTAVFDPELSGNEPSAGEGRRMLRRIRGDGSERVPLCDR